MPNLRYRRLGYVAFNVTDRARSIAFQRETMGLELVPGSEESAGVSLLTSGNSSCDLAFYDGDAPAMRRIAFEMEDEGFLELAHAHLQQLGIPVWTVPDAERAAFGQQAAFRFREPSCGLTVELYSPAAAASLPAFRRTFTNIARLGHAVVSVTDLSSFVRFFLDELNFRVSDYIGECAFLRCFPNVYHHSFAVVPGSENRLQHVNFMVDHLDDIGRSIYRLKHQEVPVVYGPGRHPPSGSVFLYFTDPDGFTFEFSSGMEEFPEVDPRAARHLPFVPESFDYWGSEPAAAFGAVGKFAALDGAEDPAGSLH